MAFGTGHHGTTLGCLRAIDRLEAEGLRPAPDRRRRRGHRRPRHGRRPRLARGGADRRRRHRPRRGRDGAAPTSPPTASPARIEAVEAAGIDAAGFARRALRPDPRQHPQGAADRPRAGARRFAGAGRPGGPLGHPGRSRRDEVAAVYARHGINEAVARGDRRLGDAGAGPPEALRGICHNPAPIRMRHRHEVGPGAPHRPDRRGHDHDRPPPSTPASPASCASTAGWDRAASPTAIAARRPHHRASAPLAAARCSRCGRWRCWCSACSRSRR